MRLVDKIKKREKEEFQKKKADSRFVWQETPKDPELFEFSENLGLTQDMPHSACPFDFLKLFLTEEFCQNKINEYAEKVIVPSKPLRRRSILNKWMPVKRFFGVIYHMGLISMPSYRHYWQKTAQYKDEFVQRTMRRDNFLAILRFLHFGDNDETYNKSLGKVKYLVDHLNNTIKDIYIPEDRYLMNHLC